MKNTRIEPIDWDHGRAEAWEVAVFCRACLFPAAAILHGLCVFRCCVPPARTVLSNEVVRLQIASPVVRVTSPSPALAA